MKNLSQLKNNGIEYLYYSIMLFLPISVFFTNVSLVLLLFLTFFFGKVSLKKALFTSLILFFFFCFFSGIIKGLFFQELSIYIRLLPLVLLPLAMSGLTKNSVNKGYFFLLAGVLIMQLIALYGIIDYYFFVDGKKVALRSYTGINEILRFERPYLGFLSAIQIFIAYWLYRKKKNAFILVMVPISIVLIILTSARLAILIVVVSFTLHFFLTLKNRTIRWAISIIIPCFSFMIIYFSDTTLKHRFVQIRNDSRITIWSGVISEYNRSSNKLFGYSSQNIVDQKLNYFYEEEADFDYEPDKQRFLRKKYNSHNQYLNELLRSGYLGLILLILPFAYLLKKTFMKENQLEFVLLASVMMFLFVENALERQVGVYLISIIMACATIKNR